MGEMVCFKGESLGNYKVKCNGFALGTFKLHGVFNVFFSFIIFQEIISKKENRHYFEENSEWRQKQNRISLYSTQWSWCEQSETRLHPFTFLLPPSLIMCDGDRQRRTQTYITELPDTCLICQIIMNRKKLLSNNALSGSRHLCQTSISLTAVNFGGPSQGVCHV